VTTGCPSPATFNDVVSFRTYLTDMDQLAAYGQVRAREATDEHDPRRQPALPARELVEVDLVAASRTPPGSTAS
jgi:enamine deaminase RidA (YjgF/YER057c/UK114 family)